MIKFFTQSKWALMSYIFFFSFYSFTQAIIKVTVTSVQVNNDEDCDGLYVEEPGITFNPISDAENYDNLSKGLQNTDLPEGLVISSHKVSIE